MKLEWHTRGTGTHRSNDQKKKKTKMTTQKRSTHKHIPLPPPFTEISSEAFTTCKKSDAWKNTKIHSLARTCVLMPVTILSAELVLSQVSVGTELILSKFPSALEWFCPNYILPQVSTLNCSCPIFSTAPILPKHHWFNCPVFVTDSVWTVLLP